MTKKRSIEIRFGVATPPIEEQLNEQGLTLGYARNWIEQLKRSANTLKMYDCLTESECAKVDKRLFKLILGHATPMAEEG